MNTSSPEHASPRSGRSDAAASSEPPDWSIVVPVFNEKARVGTTLKAIEAYIDKHGLNCELIVVDDGSTDGSSDLVERGFPRARLLRNPKNRGKGYSVRAGILAISKGQTEAAAALGLRPRKIMRLVILPQALRVIIPPLISNYLNLTKNSSLAIAVGYMDITGTLGGITMNQTGRELECVLLLMLVYLSISLIISAIMNWYNESVKLKER